MSCRTVLETWVEGGRVFDRPAPADVLHAEGIRASEHGARIVRIREAIEYDGEAIGAFRDDPFDALKALRGHDLTKRRDHHVGGMR